MDKTIFEAVNVSKIIDGIKILDEINLKLSSGEVVAITGHNGSGKSSLLKLIAGIYEQNKGNVMRQVKRMGYVPEHFPENVRFKMLEYLHLVSEIGGRRKEELTDEISQWTRLFGIESYQETPLKKLSKGTKQKVGIIQALLMKVEVILLDEPLSGLDEVSQQELIEQLSHLKNDTTIIFTSHESFLIESIADREIVLEKGKIIADQQVLKREIERIIKVRVQGKVDWKCMSGVKNFKFEGEEVVILRVRAEDSDSVLKELLLMGISILEVKEN